MQVRGWLGLLLGSVLLVTSACGDGGAEIGADADAASIDVTSDDVPPGGTIPVEHTCDGADRPPSLSWTGVPEGTEEVVVVVDDPDAPGGTFTHWTVWGLPPEDGDLDQELPARAIEGRNDFGDIGYGGPCPPEGDDPHAYRFRILAVDATVELEAGAGPEDLAEAVEGRVVAEGMLTASYGR